MTLLDFSSHPFIQKDLLNSARGLLVALGHINASTRHHCSRVIFLSNELGKLCGLTELELENLRFAASLHDIGKIGINQSIIRKPGMLDHKERVEVERHPVIGANMIDALNVDESRTIANAVRHHHENFDGSGYPEMLKGEEIPYLSRMVSLLDCYDAISEHRSYHGPRSKSKVLEIMAVEQDKGKFDPYLYNKFIDLTTSRAA